MADKLTPEERAAVKSAFLTALSEHGIVSEAAEKIGFSRQTVYDWRAEDPEFAAAWKEALLLGGESLEDVALQRARGFKETVTIDGKEQERWVRSDTLAIFMLKGIFPEKYRERVSTEISGKGGGPIEHAYNRFTAVPTEALEEVERFLSEQTDDDAAE